MCTRAPVHSASSGAFDRAGLGHGRPRFRVRLRAVEPVGGSLAQPPLDDLLKFSVQDDRDAAGRQQLEGDLEVAFEDAREAQGIGLEQRELETEHAGVEPRGDCLEAVLLGHRAVQADVDSRLGANGLDLLGQAVSTEDGRASVIGHVDDCGDARGGGGRSRDALLGGAQRVHVRADEAGQHEGVAGVDRLGGGGRGVRRPDQSGEATVEDARRAGVQDPIGGHEVAAHDKIKLRHGSSASLRMVRNSTSVPRATCSGDALSAGACETPSRHGMKTIAAGASAAT
jgi:hypothetical protein